MRALIATTGSDGDIRPFMALAKELVRRGHDVLFAAPDRYALNAAGHGLRFRKIGPPWVDAQVTEFFARVLAASTPLDQLSIVVETIAEQQLEAVPELLEMVADVDVVIYPPILVAAAAAARARNVSHVSAQLVPVQRGRDYAPDGRNLGPFLNGVLWSLAAWVLRRRTDAKLNTVVQAAGLAPWKDALLVGAQSSLLDLVAVSRHVLPRDGAWSAASHVTGYWFLDDPNFVPDPELEAFVQGEPPVVVGFGSMMGFDAEATTRTVLDAVRDLGRKVIVQAGWAGLGRSELPANVHLAQFVPHGWLFPRAACVVHHGGAGTTAAAFRAGIPQTIVWHLGDQPGWAKRTQLLGVAPGSISHKKLSASWLRTQIERMCSDRTMRETARALGEAIRTEDGVVTGVDLVEQKLARADKGPLLDIDLPAAQVD